MATCKAVLCFPAALAIAAALSSPPPLRASDERLPIGRTSDETLEVSGALLMDKDEIAKAIGMPGADLGAGVIVVRVTVRPLTDKPVKIWLDDFKLISDKDGQRCAPFQPSQLAGSAVMVVKDTGGGSRLGRMTPGIGPITMGRSPGMGNGTDQPTAVSDIKDDSPAKPNPLLVALREKALPEKTIGETVTGLLYFEIEGKVKPKNLELFYKTDTGRLGMRFTIEH